MGKTLLERPVVRLPTSTTSTTSSPHSSNASPVIEAYSGSPSPANASTTNNQQYIHDVGTGPRNLEGKLDLKGSTDSPKFEMGSPAEPQLSLPIDCGASIVDGVDLERAVRQLEMKFQGLEIQFKKFANSHKQFVRDYHDLEAYQRELVGSLGPRQSRNNMALPTRNASVNNTMRGMENNLERCENMETTCRSGSASSNRVDATSKKERPTTGRGRAMRQTSNTSNTSSESECQRQASRTRSLPLDTGGVQTQVENSSRRASSIPCDIHAQSGDLFQSRSNSSSSDWGLTDDQRIKPRTLPKRMTIETFRPREVIGSVSLGADFEAFQIPRWSTLGLDTMDTFKTAQGPSAVRKWKNGKPPASAS